MYHKSRSYDVWFLRYEVQDRIFLSSWAIFFSSTPPAPPLTAQKTKISKIKKKTQKISSFNKSVPKIVIICYAVPAMWHMTDVITFHFGQFSALLPPKQPEKRKLQINEKKAWINHY